MNLVSEKVHDVLDLLQSQEQANREKQAQKKKENDVKLANIKAQAKEARATKFVQQAQQYKQTKRIKKQQQPEKKEKAAQIKLEYIDQTREDLEGKN